MQRACFVNLHDLLQNFSLPTKLPISKFCPSLVNNSHPWNVGQLDDLMFSVNSRILRIFREGWWEQKLSNSLFGDKWSLWRALCALFVELSSFLQESANINCGKYFTCVEERALYISYERARAADYFGGFLGLPRHLLRATLTSRHNPSIATSTPPMTSAARKASSGWISRLLSQPPEPFSYWTEPLLLWVKGRSIKLDNRLCTMWQVWEKG